MVLVIATYENVRLIPLPQARLVSGNFPKAIKLRIYVKD
jgi:hypothetical protein